MKWLRLAVLAGVLLVPGVSAAESAGDAARALLKNFQEDPTRIDKARDLLEAAIARDANVDAATLITLSRAWFLFAENRTRTEEARLDAYERGRVAAQQAVAKAPNSAEAHLWYAVNLGSWANVKGLVRSLLTLRTIRQEVDTVLRLDPNNVDGNIMAGSLYRELPVLLGGDPALAEQHFKKAQALDPHLTGVHIELAQLYIDTGRIAEARRELQAVLAEAAPTDRPRWQLKEVPRARAMLELLRDKP